MGSDYVVVIVNDCPRGKGVIWHVFFLFSFFYPWPENSKLYQIFIQLAGKGLQILGSIKCKL